MADAEETSLYRTDEDLARLIGIRIDKWRAAAKVLERQGLPAKDPLFGDKRYWPAVRAFLDRRNGLGAVSPPLAPDGEENFDGYRRGRAGTKATAA